MIELVGFGILDWKRSTIIQARLQANISRLPGADMRLTTKGRFAVTAMIDLALRCADGPVTLAGIADRQKISLSYLEQLFGKLRRFELVSSVRGPGGGYALARDMAQITVADIIAAVDDPRRHLLRRQAELPRCPRLHDARPGPTSTAACTNTCVR